MPTVADANPPSLPRPMPVPIPAEVQIQRISLAQTMTVTSTKVPSSVGPVFSGVATSGSPSLPTYVNVPATSATYVNVSEIMGSGHYVPISNSQPLAAAAASNTDYTTGVTSMVGQTFVVESRPIQQVATPVVPSNIYSTVPSINSSPMRQPITSGLTQPNLYSRSENLPVGNYGTAQPVVQSMLGPGYSLNSGPTVDYTTHRSSTPPNYPLKVLPVNPPMLVSSHPHVPPGVMPQQCLPVEPRTHMPQPPPLQPPQQQPPQQQQQQATQQPQSQPNHPPHISQQGPPLTPHLHHSAIQATQNPGLTTAMVNPPMCHQPASPANLIPPTAHIPKLVVNQQSPAPLQRSPPSPATAASPPPPPPQSVSPPGSINNSPSTSSQPTTPPLSMTNTAQHPLSVIDHSVTVDDTTAGPSTPLTVLPPSTGQATALPPTTVVTPPEAPSKAEVEALAKPVSASPASTPGRGQRGGLVPTGEAWGYSNNDGNPRAAARHHSMGKFDKVRVETISLLSQMYEDVIFTMKIMGKNNLFQNSAPVMIER